MPPILNTSHSEFTGAPLCAHVQKTSLGTNSNVYLTSGYLYVSRIVYLKLVEIVFTSFSYAPYKVLPSINNILRASFFLYLFHFITHFFVGLRELQKFFSFCAFTQISHSFLNRFQPNLCPCMLYLSYCFR